MKILLVIFSFFICINNIKASSASSYVVMSMDNNQVIEQINMHESKLIASTSKIMTAIIAIENGNLDDNITATKDILEGVGSSLYIEIGEHLTLRDLLYGLMLRSGNDAAIMIANYISGNMTEFAKLMNTYAQKIGMNNTNFINSHGLEDENSNGNKSSAFDMALLTSYAYQNKTFRKIFSTKNYVAKSDKKTYTWKNKNKLLKYEYITGGKTGYTKKAKRTLVSTAKINDVNYVVVTLNDPNDWSDHISEYQNIKDNYQKITLIDKNKLNINNKNYYVKNNYYLLVKKKNNFNFSIIINLYKEKKDNVVGYIDVYENNLNIYRELIYTKKKKQFLFFKK